MIDEGGYNTPFLIKQGVAPERVLSAFYFMTGKKNARSMSGLMWICMEGTARSQTAGNKTHPGYHTGVFFQLL